MSWQSERGRYKRLRNPTMNKSPVPFRHSRYDYKVRLATVSGPDSVHWGDHPTLICREWSDVVELVEMWESRVDYPAVTVELLYKGGYDE